MPREANYRICLSQGLPSTYLNPQDLTHGNDTDFTASFSSQQQQYSQHLQPADLADPVSAATSDSTLVSSPLADSLTEFAGVLGSPPDQNRGAGQWEGTDGRSLGEGMYNPFDSHGKSFELRVRSSVQSSIHFCRQCNF